MTTVEYRFEHRFRRRPARASAFRRFTVSPFQSRRGCGLTDHRLVRRSFYGGGSLITDHSIRTAFTLPKQRERVSAPRPAVALREGGFTLLELLMVVGIIGLLLVLMAPTFTAIKGGTDVTSAAYTIKGVLDTARTYAKANNPHTWVGFYEENTANPASPNSNTPAIGRVVMSIVASKDGTKLYTGNLTSSFILDAPPNQAALIQVGKLMKIDNVHLKTFPAATATPPPDNFDRRPTPAPSPAGAAQIGDTTPPTPFLTFHYPVGTSPGQYTFTKIVQFNPRGEPVIDNSNYVLASVSEIGLQQTHGAATPAPSPVPANVAIQFTGIGGDVRIFRQ